MRPIFAVCVAASFLLAPTAKAQTASGRGERAGGAENQ